MKTTFSISMTMAATALLVTIAGCAKDPPGDVDRYAQGDERIVPLVEAADGGTGDGAITRVESWSTGAWDGPWIPYPPHIQLDIDHGLGRAPQIVAVYLSFTPNGENPGLAAGSLALLREVDATHVVVWNDTNGSYFARVVVK